MYDEEYLFLLPVRFRADVEIQQYLRPSLTELSRELYVGPMTVIQLIPYPISMLFQSVRLSAQILFILTILSAELQVVKESYFGLLYAVRFNKKSYSDSEK